MTAIPDEFVGCPWPVDPDCFEDQWDVIADETKDRCVALAGNTLRRLTGFRVGGCPITVRPCKRGCATGYPSYFERFGSPGSYGGWWPQNWGGVWINSCGCTADCSCSTICEILLPAPVGEVYEVTVDGEAVAATDYRLDGSRLVWTGTGDCPWPACQDLSADDGPGTFRVRYLNSYPVDKLGAYTAAVLAMEFAKACTGAKCRLPAGVVSVTRGGVQMEIPSGLFRGGFTGIREVDAYIGLWNPRAVTQPTSVWTPTMRSPRVVR